MRLKNFPQVEHFICTHSVNCIKFYYSFSFISENHWRQCQVIFSFFSDNKIKFLKVCFLSWFVSHRIIEYLNYFFFRNTYMATFVIIVLLNHEAQIDQFNMSWRRELNMELALILHRLWWKNLQGMFGCKVMSDKAPQYASRDWAQCSPHLSLLDLFFRSEIKSLFFQGLPLPDLKDKLKDKLIPAHIMICRSAIWMPFKHMIKC